MNAFTATSSPLLGETATPFAYTRCRCHSVVSDSRDLINTVSRSSLASTERAQSALRRSQSLDWQGAAAGRFQQRCTEAIRRSSSLDEQVCATQRTAGIGG